MITQGDGEFPYVSEALIKELERLIPPGWTPQFDTPERVIWHEFGKRAVVAMLRKHYEDQRGHSSE